MLKIVERVARALEGQSKTLKAQWKLLAEMQNLMKDIIQY